MVEKVNKDIKLEAVKRGVCYWQIADKLGISEPTLYRKLRHELSDKEKESFLTAIEAIADEQCA